MEQNILKDIFSSQRSCQSNKYQNYKGDTSNKPEGRALYWVL